MDLFSPFLERTHTMNKYLFELKKLYRNGSFLVLLVVSVMLSILNIFMVQSQNLQDNFNSANYEQYSMKFMTIFQGESDDLEDKLDASLDVSPGQMHMWSVYEDPEAIVVATEDGRGMSIENKELEFKYIREALEIDQIELNQEQKDALDYIEMLANYEKKQKEANDSYQHQGAITTLLADGSLLLGIIPLLIIAILSIRYVGEDWEEGSIVFQRTLPVRRSQVMFYRYLSSVSLLIIYLGLITLMTIMIHLIMGSGIGDWFYPYRILISNGAYLPAYQIYSIYLLIFLVKGMLLIGFTYLLVASIKKVNLAYLLTVSLFGLISILTLFFQQMQSIWNPFFVRLQEQVMGYLKLVPVNRFRAEPMLVGTPLRWGVLLVWLLFSVLFISLAIYQFKQNKSVSYLFKSREVIRIHRPEWRTFTMESLKLNHFLSKQFLSGILAVIIAGIASIILLENRSHHVQPVIADYFKENYAEIINDYTSQLEEYQVLLDQEPVGSDRAFMIESLMDFIENDFLNYYQTIYDSMSERIQAYETGDSQTYYQSFEPELSIYYNPNQMYQSLDDGLFYLPREDYYETGDFPSEYGYRISQERLEEMIRRDIRPILGSGITYTEYDRPKEAADYWSERANYQLRDNSSLGLLYRFIHIYRFDLIILVLITVAAGAGYSLEGRKRASLAWVYTLPQERVEVMHQKLLVALRRTFTIILSSVLVIGLIGVLSDGFGQWQTPILHYDRLVDLTNIANEFERSYHWMALGSVIVHSLLYVCLSSIFVILISLVLSTYFSQPWFVGGSTLLMLGIGYSLNYLPWSGWQSYLPFNYLNIVPILDGSYIFTMNIGQVNLIVGYIVLIIWIVLAYSLLRYRLKRMRLFQ